MSQSQSQSRSNHRYTDAHRYIAQKFLLFGPATRKDLTRFITEAAQKTKTDLGTTDQDLVQIVQSINAKLIPLNLRIQRANDEINGQACYVLLNSNVREIIDWKTNYTDKELDFIAKTLSAMARNNDRLLTLPEIQQIAVDCKISMNDWHRVICELKESAYLSSEFVIDREVYRFGVRLIAEMYEDMANRFEDVLPNCASCKRLIFTVSEAKDCSKCNEQSQYHIHCLKKGVKQGGLSCESCKTPF